MQVHLPSGFTAAHGVTARRFVQGESLSQDERVLLFETFDLLHQAEVETESGRMSFASVYERLFETPFADDYVRQLLEAPHARAIAESLRAQVSREILPTLKTAGLVSPDEPSSFYLLAYCLYWWYAFAKGYAFEVEVLQDLEAAGISYQAHDLLDAQTRRSPFDLAVLGFRGDIKTSTYFLHTIRTAGLWHHFYITRVYDPEKRSHIWVVFLREAAWEAIDGEAMPITLDALPAALPGIVRIQHGDVILTVVEYEEWKARVLRAQRAGMGSMER